MNSLAPVLFLPHGGGPLPLMDDLHHQSLVDFLQSCGQQYEKPKAIILISAHWEEVQLNITSNSNPDLIYDYFGFEPSAYQIQYPARGNNLLAAHLAQSLHHSGIASVLNPQRGFDHGMFVPLKLMYPLADIPVVQLSLVNDLDPKTHIEIGEALTQFRAQNVMIIGSGFSFHNMQAFFGQHKDASAKSIEFDDWLTETCVGEALGYDAQKARLIDWSNAPQARFCHPRAEHLLPLHVCFGASKGSQGQRIFSDRMFNVKVSGFAWQA